MHLIQNTTTSKVKLEMTSYNRTIEENLEIIRSLHSLKYVYNQCEDPIYE
jgi:hypothetical protein